ncbi:hypothetical protein SDC9_113901 [bioreactor metagenome]|uniref:Uncharacterized protein n=1 Tax=bioreactor metagenome TaxID=1076179 RepID=A0A645BP29_9ZZZZ
MEESILGTCFSRKLMDVVYYQDIHHLIKVEEVGKFVLYCCGVHVLCHETVGTYIQHYLFGELPFDGYTNGLCKVGLSQSGAPVQEQRIECALTRVGCNVEACRACQTVAFALYEVFE